MKKKEDNLSKIKMESINRPWSILKKISFRFLFIYFSLFIPFQNTSFPFWDVLFKYPTLFVQNSIVWLGANVYGIKEPFSATLRASGDTTFDYLFIVTSLIIAFLGTIIWTILDKKSNHYSKLYYYLTVGLRYYIALMLINYGLVKIIQLQFPSPSFYRLVEPYGSSSPMGLAWTFMGYSRGYNIFMGIAELLSVFLLFRRTMVLGAIITLATTINIMAVNFFFDIPVKLLSTHLVLMTVFLLSKDLERIIQFFVGHKATSIEFINRPVFKKTTNISINILKAFLIGYSLIYGFIEAREVEEKYGGKAPKPELYGAYKINHFSVNGDTIINYNNEDIWSTITVDRKGSLRVRNFYGDEVSYFGFEEDSLVGNLVKLKNLENEKKSFDFLFKRIDSTGLEFNFIIDGDTIHGKSKRFSKEDFLLKSRDFNWISEYPFNR